jgi:hypothetical protein
MKSGRPAPIVDQLHRWSSPPQDGQRVFDSFLTQRSQYALPQDAHLK